MVWEESQSGAPGTRAPPVVQILSFSCSFREKNWELAHPPGENPGSATDKKDGRQRWPHRFHVSCPPPPGHWIRYCCSLVDAQNVISSGSKISQRGRQLFDWLNFYQKLHGNKIIWTRGCAFLRTPWIRHWTL